MEPFKYDRSKYDLIRSIQDIEERMGAVSDKAGNRLFTFQEG